MVAENNLPVLSPDACPHYWLIDSPEGPTSLGACRYCRKLKEFFNYLEGCFFEDLNTADYKEATGRPTEKERPRKPRPWKYL